MLEAERHEIILNLLRRNQFAAIHDVLSVVDASEATVRRDFSKLEEQGYVNRVRGGAELVRSAVSDNVGFRELPFAYRKGLNLEIKRKIARAAGGYCAEGRTVIIDGGSTTYQMVEPLKSTACTIITNSFAMAEELQHGSGNRVILPGGEIYRSSELILDPFQGAFYDNYAADIAFMGVGGIDLNGLTNTDPLLIQIERKMIRSAREVIILADGSKFDQRCSLVLCGFDEVTRIITDSTAPEEMCSSVEDRGVEVVRV